MKRYEVQVSSREHELSDFFVVYTFIYDGLPYAWKMDSDSIYKFTEEEAAYYMDIHRIWADAMIRTIDFGSAN